MAQVAQLHCEAETVVIAAPLTYRREVGFGEGVVPDQFIFCRGECQPGVPLGGRQQTAARHGQSFVLRYW